jgi:cation:H+ antiporter
MIWAVLVLLGGLVLLWKGADLLSDGAVGLAERMGLSELVIGLTVVALGTSAPEMAAGIVAALGGRGDITIGNVYGANIADLSLIGGLVALIRPVEVRVAILRREIPAMLAIALLLWPVLHGRFLSRPEGAFLVAVFVLLLVQTIRAARRAIVKKSIEELHAVVEPARSAGRDLLLLALGLAALAVGARMAVHSAEAIGRRAGLSDAVIGSTILAIGTTLPELMTSTVAAVKGHYEIFIGNVVGSVIANSLLVIGVAALVRPLAVSTRLAGGRDYWIMVGVIAAFTIIVLAGKRTIRRLGGAVLLGIYVAYLLYLLNSTAAL